MGQIALAILNFESEHGHLPPAVVYGKEGQPLYSWRVAILPYMEEGALYKTFRLDEPWDSNHNLALLDKMPSLYEVPWTKIIKPQKHHTAYQAFVGPGTPFEHESELQLKLDFPDGRSNTLLFVESGPPIPWTKPADLTFDPMSHTRINGFFSDGFRSCTADGRYRFVKTSTKRSTIRALITRNGDEPPTSHQ